MISYQLSVQYTDSKLGATASHIVRLQLSPGYHIRQADVVVVAAGKKELVKGDMIKPGAVVIDCGINPLPDASKKAGVKLWGDVEYAAAKQVNVY